MNSNNISNNAAKDIEILFKICEEIKTINSNVSGLSDRIKYESQQGWVYNLDRIGSSNIRLKDGIDNFSDKAIKKISEFTAIGTNLISIFQSIRSAIWILIILFVANIIITLSL